MFDALFRLQLGPLIDRLLELETEVDDMRRRADGHNRIGTISEVDPASGLCKVSHGDLLSPWIKYANPAAGEVRETRHPSVGEQCLLINYGGGDGSAQSVALTGLPSSAFPIVSDRAELHRRVYPDGTESSYDHGSNTFEYANGPLSVKADRAGVEVMLGGVGFRLTAAGFEHVGGQVTHDGTNVGKDHLHKDTQPQQGATSGPPQ
ncbi:phage baseplate assembly protein V [Pseudomonas alloputida]|uniref:phage baseplate assembly protein V n=1 Tax=Pseudomonas alloputida TaxID=1940621 RepID=UPI001E31F5E5|nr:phage baseplate assembly protein V [Pseudomonas alloputida]MCE0871052.1 phage baseplate assembly protein V [Pseudomonas alloputida]